MQLSRLRTWMAIGNHVFIIGVSAVLVGLMVGTMIRYFPAVLVEGDILLFFLLGVLLLFLLGVGGLHYAALVRRSIKATSMIIIICRLVLFVFFLPCFIVVTACFVIQVFSGQIWIESLVFYIPMMYFIFCYLSNGQWLEHLKATTEANESQTDNDKQAFQFTLREMMIWAVIVSIMASGAGYVFRQ
ncbi:MAG: hypothetical protein JXM70_19715 [Pirellulales bacterium]|nr:hypothetical protein [Pirellulales bacterium]